MAQEDPDIVLLNYRNTPHSATKVSPAKALMGRHLRTRPPVLSKLLAPEKPDDSQIRSSDQAAKLQYKVAYEQRHRARALPSMEPGQPVLMKLDGERRWGKPGTVIQSDEKNCTYLVDPPTGVLRRNRKHLQQVLVPVPYHRVPEPRPDDEIHLPEVPHPAPPIVPPSPVPSSAHLACAPPPGAHLSMPWNQDLKGRL